MKTAIITGSAGQDGVYLSNYLVKLGYQVLGISRDPATVDLTSAEEVFQLLRNTDPREVYHLAAFHHSAQEKLIDDLAVLQRSYEVHVLAAANFLEGIRRCCPGAHFFYPASCHVFGTPPEPIQDESTPLKPEGVYGITKQAGMSLCRFYRQQHGVFASVGILYNHESPLRRPEFVSKKIVEGVVAVHQGRRDKLELGDLDAEIDWGYAGDYVVAMHQILQLPQADDFVISSGEKHSVREFVEEAFRLVGLDWRQYVVVDPSVLRSQKRVTFFGNPAKLMQLTSWKPSTSFRELVRIMVMTELEKHERDQNSAVHSHI